MKPNLHHILIGCSKRKRQSQKALYELFYPYAMSIAVRYLQDEGEAETVVNDSFLKVFENIKKFDLEKPFKPWLRQILVNTAINDLKKKKKLAMNTNISEAERFPDKERILSALSYQDLVAMVHTLSDAYRTVFNMYVIDGYKHEEIAEKLNISVGTSKSNLSKARAKLKVIVNEKLAFKNV